MSDERAEGDAEGDERRVPRSADQVPEFGVRAKEFRKHRCPRRKRMGFGTVHGRERQTLPYGEFASEPQESVGSGLRAANEKHVGRAHAGDEAPEREGGRASVGRQSTERAHLPGVQRRIASDRRSEVEHEQARVSPRGDRFEHGMRAVLPLEPRGP